MIGVFPPPTHPFLGKSRHMTPNTPEYGTLKDYLRPVGSVKQNVGGLDVPVNELLAV